MSMATNGALPPRVNLTLNPAPSEPIAQAEILSAAGRIQEAIALLEPFGSKSHLAQQKLKVLKREVRVGHGLATLPILSLIGFVNQGGTPRNMAALESLKSMMKTGRKTLSESYQSLPSKMRRDLEAQVGRNNMECLITISGHSDATAYWDDLVHWALDRKKSSHPNDTALAKEVLAYVVGQNTETASPLLDRAREALAALNGTGTLGARVEQWTGNLLDHATDAKMIAPMVLASPVFHLGRAATLRGLLASGTENALTRGLGARALSGLAGLTGETAFFSLSSRGLIHSFEGPVPWDTASVLRDMGAAGLTLGLLKTVGFMGRQGMLHRRGLNELHPQGWTKADHRAMWFSGQASGYLGLVTAHFTEEQLGLRPHLPGSNIWADAFGTHLALGLGSHLGRKFLGSDFINLEHRLATQTKILSNASNISRGFRGEQSPLEYLKNQWAPSVKDFRSRARFSPSGIHLKVAEGEDPANLARYFFREQEKIPNRRIILNAQHHSSPLNVSLQLKRELQTLADRWATTLSLKINQRPFVFEFEPVGQEIGRTQAMPLWAAPRRRVGQTPALERSLGEVADQQKRALTLLATTRGQWPLETVIKLEKILKGFSAAHLHMAGLVRALRKTPASNQGEAARRLQKTILRLKDQLDGFVNHGTIPTFDSGELTRQLNAEFPNGKSDFELRGYQERMVANLIKDFEKTDHPWLGLASPMQTGKSFLIGPIIRGLLPLVPKGSQFIVLSSARVITNQLVQDLLTGFSPKDIGVFDSEVKIRRPLTVASIPTLVHHLDQFPTEGFTILLTDEAYSTQSKSLSQIYEYFGLGERRKEMSKMQLVPRRGPGLVVGLSGTGGGLEGYHLSDHLDLLTAIEDGWVRNLEGERVFMRIPSKTVRGASEKRMIWWRASEANAEALAEIYEDFLHSKRDPALVFVPTIRHGELLEAAFQKRFGENYVDLVHSKKTPEENEKILSRRTRRGGALISVDMLNHGFRGSGYHAVFHTYQTQSSEKFSQRTGRAWGKAEGPLFILETTWNKRQNYANLARLLGMADYPIHRIDTRGLRKRVDKITESKVRNNEIQAAVERGEVQKMVLEVPSLATWRARFRKILEENGGVDVLAEQFNLPLDTLTGFALGSLPLRLSHVMELAPLLGGENLARKSWVEAWEEVVDETLAGARSLGDSLAQRLLEWREFPGEVDAKAETLNKILQDHFKPSTRRSAKKFRSLMDEILLQYRDRYSEQVLRSTFEAVLPTFLKTLPPWQRLIFSQKTLSNEATYSGLSAELQDRWKIKLGPNAIRGRGFELRGEFLKRFRPALLDQLPLTSTPLQGRLVEKLSHLGIGSLRELTRRSTLEFALDPQFSGEEVVALQNLLLGHSLHFYRGPTFFPGTPEGIRRLQDPLDLSGLSTRAQGIFINQKISTLYDLVRLSEIQFLKLKNAGSTTLEELKRKLASQGLSFGMDLGIYRTPASVLGVNFSLRKNEVHTVADLMFKLNALVELPQGERVDAYKKLQAWHEDMLQANTTVLGAESSDEILSDFPFPALNFSELKLSLRDFPWKRGIRRTFRNHNLRTVLDLVRYSEMDFRGLKGVGVSTAREVGEFLFSFDLRGGMPLRPYDTPVEALGLTELKDLGFSDVADLIVRRKGWYRLPRELRRRVQNALKLFDRDYLPEKYQVGSSQGSKAPKGDWVRGAFREDPRILRTSDLWYPLPRLRNIRGFDLRAHGIHTLFDLLSYTSSDLREKFGVSPPIVESIKEYLEWGHLALGISMEKLHRRVEDPDLALVPSVAVTLREKGVESMRDLYSLISNPIYSGQYPHWFPEHKPAWTEIIVRAKGFLDRLALPHVPVHPYVLRGIFDGETLSRENFLYQELDLLPLTPLTLNNLHRRGVRFLDDLRDQGIEDLQEVATSKRDFEILFERWEAVKDL